MKRNVSLKLMFLMILTGVAFVLLSTQPSMAAYLVQPTAYWQLEEADPGTDGVADETGAADGACTNCPTASVTGQIGNAFTFDGVNDSVVFSDPSDDVFDFAAGASFSIELWMKHDGTLPLGGDQAMIGRYAGASNVAWWLGVNTDGTVSSHMWDADGPYNATQLVGTTTVVDGAWHHIVFVRDATADKIMIYVDGVLDAARSGDTNLDGSFAATADATLGRFGGSMFYAGSLDNVAIYADQALSTDEVSQNFLNGGQGQTLAQEFAPVFSGDASDTIAVGFIATMQARAASNPLPTYSSSNLPTGGGIDPSGVITWLPLDTQIGANLFNVNANNSQGSDSQAWNVEVVDLCASALDGYWQLEEADPGTDGVADETGAADGACTNCPTASVTGQIGNAFTFDGVNDSVVYSDPSDDVFDFAAGVSFSIELWMKHDGTLPLGGDQAMIGRYAGLSDVAWWVGVNAGGTVSSHIWDADGPYSSIPLEGTTTVVDGAWHHIVFVRDATADKIMIYVDGVLDALRSGDANLDGSFAATADATLGRFGGSMYYAGSLDEVAVYGSTALSETMIRQHFNADTGHHYCNAAPTIDSTEVTAATEDVNYTYDADATDPEGHTLTWSLTQNPTGMTIDSSTGLVSWTPGDGVASASVTIQVADQYGATDTQSYTIAVTTVNDAPIITGQADPGLSTPEDTALTITLAQLTVNDPDNSYPADFALTVQDGSNYTRVGNQITPDAEFSGTLSIPVMVNDGDLDSNVYNLQVAVAAVNDDPVISTTSPTTATVGTEYTYDAEASDVDSTTLTWSLSAAPSGMVVDSTTGEVTWTPDAGSVGDVTFTLSVSDGDGGSDDEIITITVSAASGSGGGGGGGGCFIGSMDF